MASISLEAAGRGTRWGGHRESKATHRRLYRLGLPWNLGAACTETIILSWRWGPMFESMKVWGTVLRIAHSHIRACHILEISVLLAY